jgi:mono/diheme cytochrome c family protein
MKYIISLFGILVILYSCSENTVDIQSQPDSGSILSENNIPLQIFKLDINTDNSLITNGGVVVQIPKGSLTSDKNPVELEIREALTMKDIFVAGLQTTSNGEPLSSGGMIYINARQGYNVSIKEKLKVFVPTQAYNSAMQIYDGVKDSIGNLNWVNPTPLPQTNTSKRITHGEQLFMSNCASCHAVHNDATGPALYNVQTRRPKQWLYDFTRNSAKLISLHRNENKTDSLSVISQTKEGKVIRQKVKQTDTAALALLLGTGKIQLAAMHDTALAVDYYSWCIYNKWNKTAMTAFPKLTDKDLNDLYTFIKLESDKRPELAAKFKNTCCDSCEIYRKAAAIEEQKLSKIYEEQNKLFSIQQTISLNKNKLVAKQSNTVVFSNTPPTATNVQPFANPSPIIASTFENVSPELYTGVYYELDLKTFGWKNIDVLIAGQDGVINSMLWVRVAESTSHKIRVQLLLPSHKISLTGGRVEGDKFSFKTTDGKINLPQGAKCFIVAMSEKEDKLFFDMKEFTSTANQTINMTIQEKSAIEINAALNSLNIEGLTSNIKQKEHIQEIRKMEKEIQQIQQSINQYETIKDSVLKRLKKLDYLKPKNCGCDDDIASEFGWDDVNKSKKVDNYDY